MGIYFNFKEIISAFMVLFAVIDILGAIPIIISLREKNQKIEAGKAAIVSFVILVAFFVYREGIIGIIQCRYFFFCRCRSFGAFGFGGRDDLRCRDI